MEVVHLDHEKLRTEMESVFRSQGVAESSIDAVCTSLIQTSLRGVDSHGVHLFPHYTRAINSERISSDPQLEVENTSASTGVLDAKDAFGHYAGKVAIQHAMKQAWESGMFAVNVRNSTHFGAAAYFALQAAEEGLIGMSFTNADALVKASGSTKAFFGTNPICFCAPLANEDPFCLDMATSLVSWNKIKNYRVENESIPEHWAYDGEGSSVSDPHDARSLSPAGDYKGFGLGMMVDIFCGILANGFISKDILAMYDSPIEAKRKVSHFFMVIDPSKFLPIEAFKENMQSMVDRIREMPQLADEQPMVPGDPEKRTKKERLVTGIPMPAVVFDEFVSISGEFKNCVKHG